MKYYLVAGEASGDLHGANLMKALKEKDKHAEFRFYGGDKMLSEGGEIAKHYADMAFMGFAEIVANLRTISKNLAACKHDIAAWQPDVLILIDFPGFNLRIAADAKAKGFMVCYYISPKVWAWNQKRVLKIKRVVDHLFCILPFEVDFYKKWDMQVDYVGNPLLDAISDFKPDVDFRKTHNLSNKKLVALLPGSRKQEISRLLPDMVMIAQKWSDYEFVIAGAPTFNQAYYDQYLAGAGIRIVYNATYDLLSNAHAAVVASGTASLETALFNVPQVVVYKSSAISMAIARMVVKVKYASLVNLIMEEEVVKELIQPYCTSETINAELENILNNKTHSDKILANYQELFSRMGRPGASARTAALIIKYAGKK
ncbi:MAG: lipid-A-disaccharide synthase [Sphingobacteriales bacterium]